MPSFPFRDSLARSEDLLSKTKANDAAPWCLFSFYFTFWRIYQGGRSNPLSPIELRRNISVPAASGSALQLGSYLKNRAAKKSTPSAVGLEK